MDKSLRPRNRPLLLNLWSSNQSTTLYRMQHNSSGIWIKPPSLTLLSLLQRKRPTSVFLFHSIYPTSFLPNHYKFIPCDGTFTPEDKEQLRAIEEEHKLESGSILSASWIKKPKHRSPNQKTANIKVICSSHIMANHLLLERIFIANTWVIVLKDAQEPIRCNKCQKYGHIREGCSNDERCANCANPTPQTPAPNPMNTIVYCAAPLLTTLAQTGRNVPNSPNAQQPLMLILPKTPSPTSPF